MNYELTNVLFDPRERHARYFITDGIGTAQGLEDSELYSMVVRRNADGLRATEDGPEGIRAHPTRFARHSAK